MSGRWDSITVNPIEWAELPETAKQLLESSGFVSDVEYVGIGVDHGMMVWCLCHRKPLLRNRLVDELPRRTSYSVSTN